VSWFKGFCRRRAVPGSKQAAPISVSGSAGCSLDVVPLCWVGGSGHSSPICWFMLCVGPFWISLFIFRRTTCLMNEKRIICHGQHWGCGWDHLPYFPPRQSQGLVLRGPQQVSPDFFSFFFPFSFLLSVSLFRLSALELVAALSGRVWDFRSCRRGCYLSGVLLSVRRRVLSGLFLVDFVLCFAPYLF